MSVTALAAADPVAAVIAWLRGHGEIVAALGGEDRISGLNEAPYPRLQVVPSPGGSDRDLVWRTEPEVALVTYGSLDGTPGQSALRGLHYLALAVVRQLPNSTFTSTQAVVSTVRPSSAARWAPEPLTRQPAWRSTLIVSIHPPREIP